MSTIRGFVLRRLRKMAARRPPDFVIGGADKPYLRRWWVIPRNRFFNVYFHEFCRSDDDRALHDHPWLNLSWVLEGGYHEWVPGPRPDIYRLITRRAGDVAFRLPTALHPIELLRVDDGPELPVRTLFVTGPAVRDWGFRCPQGWRPWQEFVSPTDKGGIGRGCD